MGKHLVLRAIRFSGFEVRRIENINKNISPGEIAFLHIGKNAGTQIMHVAGQLTNQNIHIRKFGHKVKLSEVPNGMPYFFSIRDPARRFVSGFYSRKRKGRPRLYNEWSPQEKIAFETFSHANELAEALFDDNGHGELARAAILSIQHTSRAQTTWFQGNGFLEQRPPLTIIRQEKFTQDMQRLLQILGAEGNIADYMTDDPVDSHVNDYRGAPPSAMKRSRISSLGTSRIISFMKLVQDGNTKITARLKSSTRKLE